MDLKALRERADLWWADVSIDLFNFGLYGAVGLAVLGPMIVLGLQGIAWLRNGYWTTESLARTFGITPSGTWTWVGAQKIARTICEAELGLLFLLLGIVAALFFSALANDARMSRDMKIIKYAGQAKPDATDRR
jgi:hypothetical protein